VLGAGIQLHSEIPFTNSIRGAGHYAKIVNQFTERSGEVTDFVVRFVGDMLLDIPLGDVRCDGGELCQRLRDRASEEES